MYFHHVRNANEACNRVDVAQENEIEMFVKRGVDGVGGIDQNYRVTVGRGLGDGIGTQIVAGTRTILDDELLTKTFAQPVGNQPPATICGATGRIADNNVRLA